jgi:predicted phage terminase large subunit-like protein
VPTAADGEDGELEAERVILAKHHLVLLAALQDVADGTAPNLMVFMPPGSAKSTYVDVVFVPWFMARKEKQSVILACYGSDLARKQGRRARALVKSQSFQDLFDARLSAESSAMDEWGLSNGSEYMSGGILSGMTGNRADLLVVDDPVKGRADADSEAIRKTTRSEYDESLCTRLKPGGRQIIIQTRWHGDDLSGSILPENWDGESGMILGRDGRMWRVLCIPAEAASADDPLGRKPGEMLWPEWFTPEYWTPLRKNRRAWSALYQQKPSPEEGTYFQRANFREWKAPLPTLRFYGTSDYAVTEGGGDFTVHRVWGVSANGDIYRVDGWSGQTASDVWIERKIDLIAKWKPLAWFGESGVIKKAIEPALLRRMRERKTYCRLEWLPSISDKPSRARGFQSRASMGAVYFEPNADLREFLMFPAGKHDDEVDAASLIGRALEQAHPAISKAPPANSNNPTDSYFGRREGTDTWQTL